MGDDGTAVTVTTFVIASANEQGRMPKRNRRKTRGYWDNWGRELELVNESIRRDCSRFRLVG